MKYAKAARAALKKGESIDPDNIDNNYFYGEYLIDQGDYAKARSVLEHALAAPALAGRPVFDKGRRNDIRALLTVVAEKTES